MASLYESQGHNIAIGGYMFGFVYVFWPPDVLWLWRLLQLVWHLGVFGSCDFLASRSCGLLILLYLGYADVEEYPIVYLCLFDQI